MTQDVGFFSPFNTQFTRFKKAKTKHIHTHNRERERETRRDNRESRETNHTIIQYKQKVNIISTDSVMYFDCVNEILVAQGLAEEVGFELFLCEVSVFGGVLGSDQLRQRSIVT